MKRIHVIATSKEKVIVVACPSDIPKSLKNDETIKKEWFYNNPEELNNFLDQNPDQLDYFLKGFSYWIMFRVYGYNEQQNRYGKLKRAIQEFSKDLFRKIRGLAVRIAKEVKKILKPKSALHDEARKQKQVYRAIMAYQAKYTG